MRHRALRRTNSFVEESGGALRRRYSLGRFGLSDPLSLSPLGGLGFLALSWMAGRARRMRTRDIPRIVRRPVPWQIGGSGQVLLQGELRHLQAEAQPGFLTHDAQCVSVSQQASKQRLGVG